MPLISVIVPVYNAEKTLDRCLASLQSQRERDFEVLMIQNGSTDKSAAICKKYAAEDDRFCLISMAENCGPSGARNVGLEEARGRWIAFVDSDDYVEPDYLSTIREAFEKGNPDVVFFGYHQISVDGQNLGEHIPEADAVSYLEKLAELSQQNMFGYTWIKVFRREAVGDTRFPVDLNLFEDEVFACEVLARCGHIAVIPRALYNYVTGNATSLMGRTHPDYPRKCDRVYRAWKNLLENSENKEKILAEKADTAVSRCMYYCYERDVELKPFVDSLAGALFFSEHTQWNKFDRLVQARQYAAIGLEKAKYRMKVKLAKLLGR